MNGFEFNKISAAVLLTGLSMMVISTVVEILYEPHEPEKRGYEVEVAEEATGGAQQAAAPVEVNVAQLMAAANAEAGAASAKKCAACHDFSKGGPNKVGPNLWEVVNAKKGGHAAGYAYSNALIGHGGTWTYEDLYHFINAPQKFIPGTKMSFAGIKKPEEVANVIAYLRSLSDAPAALPAR